MYRAKLNQRVSVKHPPRIFTRQTQETRRSPKHVRLCTKILDMQTSLQEDWNRKNKRDLAVGETATHRLGFSLTAGQSARLRSRSYTLDSLSALATSPLRSVRESRRSASGARPCWLSLLPMDQVRGRRARPLMSASWRALQAGVLVS